MSGTSHDPRGVLLMALGGPTNLDDVEPYLLDLRGGRPTPPELVEEFRERYRRIGGGSPLVAVTRAQAAALERKLSSEGAPVPCEVGMRHWHPQIREGVASLVRRGATEVTGLCMTPYYSPWSVGGYLSALDQVAAESAPAVRLHRVETWHDAPTLAEAFARKILERIDAMTARGDPRPALMFTAHSLPGAADPGVEPYVRQLARVRAAVTARLPPVRSEFAYQSVGRREGPWLLPSWEGLLERLAHDGERSVLVVPFGFVADNLEILFDVDLEMRARAAELGLAFDRTESLNDDPLLIDALAHAVRGAGRTG